MLDIVELTTPGNPVDAMLLVTLKKGYNYEHCFGLMESQFRLIKIV